MDRQTDAVNGMYITMVCSECKGTGIVTVYNAYDPDYREDVECSVCFGTGKVSNKVELQKD